MFTSCFARCCSRLAVRSAVLILTTAQRVATERRLQERAKETLQEN
jgi:hypothetical protein